MSDPSVVVNTAGAGSTAGGFGANFTGTMSNANQTKMITNQANQISNQAWLGAGNQLLGLGGVIAKGILDGKALDLKFDAQLKGYDLAVKKMALDEVLSEVALKMHEKTEETKQEATKELATVEKVRIRQARKGKTERARIGARYTHLNNKFYNHGQPKFPASNPW